MKILNYKYEILKMSNENIEFKILIKGKEISKKILNYTY